MIKEEIFKIIEKTLDSVCTDDKGRVIEIICRRNDDRHFEAVIVSNAFHDKTLMQQHQMIMQPMTALFQCNLHALRLNTYTPSEWKEKKYAKCNDF